MGGGIPRRDGAVPALSDNFAVHHHHRAHRHLAFISGPLREGQRMPHETFVRFLHVASA